MKESIETFRDIRGWELNNLVQEKPDCFNMKVSIEKFKVTVKKVDEPIEILTERLQKLWEESDNYHHYHPLMKTTKRLGVKLKGSHGDKRSK